MKLNNEIVQDIKQARAHARAAEDHDGKSENNLKSAAASMYAGFTKALLEQPKYGQVTEKQMLTIYKSTTPRPWWDAYLKAGGYITKAGNADREGAMRLIQEHIDPKAAIRRRIEQLSWTARSHVKQHYARTHGCGSRKPPLTPEYAHEVATAMQGMVMTKHQAQPLAEYSQNDILAKALAAGRAIVAKLPQLKQDKLEYAHDVLTDLWRDLT